MLVVPDSTSLAVLQALVAAKGLLDGAIVHLFQVDITPTRDTTLTELTDAEADFTGYAASAAVVWGDPYYAESGQPYVPGDLKTFTVGAGPVTPNVIYGYYVTNDGATELLWSERYASPKSMVTTGQALQQLPVFGAVSQAGG